MANELIDIFNQSALARCEGDRAGADYLLNKSYFEYYYDLLQHNKYYEQRNKVYEDLKKNRKKR